MHQSWWCITYPAKIVEARVIARFFFPGTLTAITGAKDISPTDMLIWKMKLATKATLCLNHRFSLVSWSSGLVSFRSCWQAIAFPAHPTPPCQSNPQYDFSHQEDKKAVDSCDLIYWVIGRITHDRKDSPCIDFVAVILVKVEGLRVDDRWNHASDDHDQMREYAYKMQY